MSSLVDCPHCRTRVLPMAGRRCPACRKDVDSPPPEPTPEQVAQAVYGDAARQMLRGVAPSEIQARLARRRLDTETAATVVDDLKRIKAGARRSSGRRNMICGALLCVGGVAATVGTYQAAVARGGGIYLVARGPILFGGVQFVRGLIQSLEE
jgi:hypothetical protein